MDFRLAVETDAESVAALMNAHNSSVDSEVSVVDKDSALGFINGYFSPNPAVLLTREGSNDLIAAVNLQPDPNRKSFQVELFCNPEFDDVAQVLEWIIEKARSENSDWQIHPGANAKDSRVIKAWSRLGFEIERRFSVMRLEIVSSEIGSSREDISISAINTSDESQLRIWHSLHQNAFSSHFGFSPRSFEDWIQIVTRDPSFDPRGVLVGVVKGEPVGFCHLTDEFSSDNRGFVIGLGIAQSHRGLGYGEALLHAGIAYCASKGYSSVELAVDTGNESGALRLYEKTGFKITAAWVHFAKH